MTERITGRTKMWEILNRILPSERKLPRERFVPTPLPPELADKANVVPLIEVDKLSFNERKALEEKSAREFQRQLDFQNSLNQTAEEFFGQGKTNPSQE